MPPEYQMIALDADGIDLDALTPAQKMGAAFAVVRSESSLAAVRSPLRLLPTTCQLWRSCADVWAGC